MANEELERAEGRTEHSERRNEHRQKSRYLGKGGFSVCYAIEDQHTGDILAGKVVSKIILEKPRSRAKLETEILIHGAVRHRNIVRFWRCFEDENNVYMILELCKNQTLAELVKRKKRLPEPVAARYLHQTLDGLRYLHSKHVIHRDLKLGNLFLDDETVKIGDFGLACQLEYEGQRKNTMCGTPNYIAPEVLGSSVGHSYEVDIWSLGVILYAMLIGRPPFETSDVKSTYRRIKANAYKFPEDTSISAEAQDLIRATLSANPADRPTITEFYAHPFLQRYYGDDPRAADTGCWHVRIMAGSAESDCHHPQEYT
eukprot:gene7816-9284_t